MILMFSRYPGRCATFHVELGPEDWIAKWTDFGTADTDSSSCGQPIGVVHYTTLENTAPELWVLGDAAKQVQRPMRGRCGARGNQP